MVIYPLVTLSTFLEKVVDLAPVVDRLDEALQRINHYRLNKNHRNLLSYPLDADIRPFNNLTYLLIASQVHVITWLPQWLKMFFVTCFQLKFGTMVRHVAKL